MAISFLYFYQANAQIDSLAKTKTIDSIKEKRHSYTKNELTNLISIHSESLHFNAESAWNHIDSNTIYLLFDDNCTGIFNFDNNQDSAFQKKYHIRFCLAPQFGNEDNDFVAYNAVIFAYLDKKYRKKWRNEIRKGAIGLKE